MDPWAAFFIGVGGTFLLMFAWAFGCFMQGWRAAHHEWVQSSKNVNQFVTVDGKHFFAVEFDPEAPEIEDESEYYSMHE